MSLEQPNFFDRHCRERIYGEKGQTFEEFCARLPQGKTYELCWDHGREAPYAVEVRVGDYGKTLPDK